VHTVLSKGTPFGFDVNVEKKLPKEKDIMLVLGFKVAATCADKRIQCSLKRERLH